MKLGAEKAKGKYIMEVDADNMYLNENLFDIMYEEDEKNNTDIVQMEKFYIKSLDERIYLDMKEYPRLGRIKKKIYQPKLIGYSNIISTDLMY